MANSREQDIGASGDDPPPAPAQADLGDQLKTMFGELSSGPMPSSLLDLADRLEEAFQRGDLFDCPKQRPHAS